MEHCRKVATYLASRERDLSDMAPKERCSSALLRCPGQLEGRRGHLALQGRLQRTLLQGHFLILLSPNLSVNWE